MAPVTIDNTAICYLIKKLLIQLNISILFVKINN